MSNRVLSSIVDEGCRQLVESPTILCLKGLHDGPCPHMAKGKCREPDKDQGDRCDHGDIVPKEKSFFDITLETITTKNSKDLFYARPSEPVHLTPELPPPADPPLAKPESPFEKPTFLHPKPLFHSPKISPSSIPNPSPSIMSNKHMEPPTYPNYGSYLYNIPGYSAFQPVSYSGMLPPQPPIIPNPNEIPPAPEYTPYPTTKEVEEKIAEPKTSEAQTVEPPPPTQMDFEEQFQPEITKITVPEDINKTESKMSITSLAQGSGATVTIPSQIPKDTIKKKPPERFSLKTSIPISKIDMKCVTNTTDTIAPTAVTKKPTTFNPAFNTKHDSGAKVEIQSNIIIKSAPKDTEVSEKPAPTTTASVISTLLNAAEAVNKNDSQFRKVEPKTDVINEIKDPPPIFPPTTNNITRPVFNPINIESSKGNFPPKPAEGNIGEQKNQILLIQNKNQNPKMLLTIQQQNPQVLLQRTNFDSKNGQVPSRLSSQSKKCKEDIIENGTSSKVVALKRMHQENCDENDFENLITENQIYGNKIVVKEKSQGTLQEQDLKNKKSDKQTQETKNVVLQPNFVYLSNVQFPNLMMIKNNAKINQTEPNKTNKITPNENKITNEASTMTNTTSDTIAPKTIKPQNVNVSKEIHVLKSSNNVLQTLSNKNSKTDLVFQAPHQKVIMNSQIVYQVVDADNKLNQQFVNREYPKFISQNKKEFPKQFDQKQNDKLFIACPYQMDSKLQPKIVITNIRPKKVDEVSALDIYEKRKRMRRMKYLSNRDPKDSKETAKTELKKPPERVDSQRNIITPDKIKEEIYKEFANTRMQVGDESSESESDYGEGDIEEYKAVIKEYAVSKEDDDSKAEFLTNFGLGTKKDCKDKELDRQERIIRRDSVASAYITAGRLDRLMNEDCRIPETIEKETRRVERKEEIEKGVTLQMKHMFLSQLKLTQVTPQSKEGYEKIWQEVLRERNRRNGVKTTQVSKQTQTKQLELDPNSQLQLLTEIKKSVNENNNLIKKRLDSTETENAEGDSIHTLAEKNFTELNKLSKMADISVKIMTGQESRKRDLNPGFDSSNIQKLTPRIEQPNVPCINVPNINKIISLKSQESPSSNVVQTQTTQATSMDEPASSAGGVEVGGRKEAECQVDVALPWPGLEAVIRSYREFEVARKKEISDMHKRNTSLRVDGAHITRAASRDADQARALLAERQLLVNEEANVRHAIHKLQTAVVTIRNYC